MSLPTTIGNLLFYKADKGIIKIILASENEQALWDSYITEHKDATSDPRIHGSWQLSMHTIIKNIVLNTMLCFLFSVS